MRTNDIWAFLHDDAQQWYFRADMDHRQAYVFDTLGEPHGAFILPGEEVVEQYYLQLRQLCDQLKAGVAVVRPAPVVMALPAATTAPLRRAIVRMAEAMSCVPVDSPTSAALAGARGCSDGRSGAQISGNARGGFIAAQRLAV